MLYSAQSVGRGMLERFPLYHRYQKWRGESQAKDSATKSLDFTVRCIKDFNSKLTNPEQPAYTMLIGKGKAKLVYSGYRQVPCESRIAVPLVPNNRIEGVAYIIPRDRLGVNDELRQEVEEGQRIKNSVYLANLQLFAESLGEDRDRAKISAAVLITQFPTIEDLVQGVESNDPRLKSYIEKSSSKDPHGKSFQRLVDCCLHLGVDLVDAPHIVIQGKPAVIAKMAQNDLENAVRKAPYPFPQSAKLAFQLMKGFRELHAGGYVHGDVKLENALLYDFDGKPIVKIADWGKSEKLESGEVKLHTGNRRHMPPERLCSQKGEVFGVAMMVVRILEEEFLTASSKEMLTQPIAKDPDKEKRLQDEENPSKCRKGIERFLSISLGCPEVDTVAIDAIPHALSSVLSILRKKPVDIDSQLGKYLYALQTGLENKYGQAEEKRIAIRDLVSLLRAMTRSDPLERITMEEAVTRFEECLGPFQQD